jgi:ribonuclease HI
VPWIRARLRGQPVLARATERGELASRGGRVEIRYRPDDGRAYHASASNLTVAEPTLYPDDHCVPAAEAAAPRAPAAKRSAGGSGAATSRAKPAAAPIESLSEKDAAEHAVAYTDGACTGNPGPAGLGVVLLDAGKRVELSEYLGTGTNNIAELTAVLRALEMTKGRVVIHTDSQYSIGILTKGWKAKLNKELVGRIREVLADRPGARLVYVPGHAGVPLNERADELAREAIRTGQTRRQEV